MENNKRKDSTGGIIFVGCLMLGIAVGMYTGHTGVGTMAGLGIGFIAKALVRMSK